MSRAETGAKAGMGEWGIGTALGLMYCRRTNGLCYEGAWEVRQPSRPRPALKLQCTCKISKSESCPFELLPRQRAGSEHSGITLESSEFCSASRFDTNWVLACPSNPLCLAPREGPASQSWKRALLLFSPRNERRRRHAASLAAPRPINSKMRIRISVERESVW